MSATEAPGTPALRRDLATLLVLGLVMLLYWLATTHLQFNQDSADYLDNARNLARQPHERYAAARPPGYPLLMVATGVTRFHTFRGLEIAQAAMALAIPFLVYFTLLPLGRKVAFPTAVVAIALPMTWVYSAMLMTEQVSMFLQLLFVFLASRHFARERPPAFLWAATLTAFAMTLVRPASGLVFWVFLPIALLVPPRRVRQPLLAAGLYCSLLVAWSGADWLFTGHCGNLPSGVQLSASLVEQPFAETYFSTWSASFRDYRHPRPLVVPERGPASRALYECLAAILRGKPAAWLARPPFARFGAFGGNPDALLRELFLRPGADYFNFIFEEVTARLGPKAANDLFAALPREYGRGGLRGLAANLSLGVPSNLGGACLFWQASVAGRHHGAYDPDRPFRLVRPENGPATRQLFTALEGFGAASGRYDAGAARRLVEDPAKGDYDVIWYATLQQYGAAASDRLLRDVALEAFRAYPRSTLLFWDNLLMLAAGPNDVLYGVAARTTDLAGVLYLSSWLDVLPPKMRAEVSGAKPATPVFDALYRLAYLLKPLLLVSCLILLSFGWAGPARPLFALLLLLAASQVAVTSVMAQAHQRYADQVYLLLVMAVAIGVHGALRRNGAGEGGCRAGTGDDRPSGAALQGD
jgi:hypothetical protein